jgi:type I restriction enzyme S subunit
MIADLKPYAEYKESGLPWLGQVPGHWGIRRLKSHLLRNDAGVWGTAFDEQGTAVLRSTEQSVDGAWRIVHPARLLLSESQKNSALLDVGDLVVTKSSGSALHIGKTSLVTPRVAEMKCCFSNFMQRLRVSNNVSPIFAWILLNSRVAREQFVYQTTTTTGLGNLTGTILGNCTFSFPPLDEQAAIVRFLDWTNGRLERAILAKRKVIALLNEQKQAIIHRAVTRGLDPSVRLKPSGIPWLGDIPQHWEVRRAKHLYREVDERSMYGSEELLSVSHLTGVTPRSQKNITMFKAASYAGHKLCRPGDLVVNTMWAWMGALGVSNHAGIISPAYAVYRPRRPAGIIGIYMDGLLRSRPYVSNIICRSTGLRASRLRLYPEEFFRLPIIQPPANEQRQIVETIREETIELDTTSSRLEREIELLREYRTRLVADVVTGKLDVREAAMRLPEDTAPDDSDSDPDLDPEPAEEAAET